MTVTEFMKATGVTKEYFFQFVLPVLIHYKNAQIRKNMSINIINDSLVQDLIVHLSSGKTTRSFVEKVENND